MCGEHTDPFKMKSYMDGSPPHVRGTHEFDLNKVKVDRITPACAGNTPAADQLGNQKPDHPRMCGEHQVAIDDRIRQLGSPPHVRGTPNYPVAPIQNRRITPACAGNTVQS